jgi:holin-like protein
MIEAVSRVLIWLCVGEILARLALIPMPSAVIGLVLLYLDLLWHNRLPDDLGKLADRLLSLFGLLFVPAGVGLVAHVDVLRAEAIPILAAVAGGTVVTLLATIATTMLFQSWYRRRPPANPLSSMGKADRHA